ncbi:MAG: hypothetical protein Q7W02_24460 [Candidatus Rokubacteria bacterium]|nr:hypothetical protein [Candidatus Rokubacteria bacterium]
MLPLELVTVTFRAPSVVPLLIVSVAVSCVADTIATLLTVTPTPLTLTVTPAANPDPLIVTGTVAPAAPCVGATELTVMGATTVKPPVSVPPTPPVFATVTLRVPSAVPLAIVSVAVSCVADFTVTLLDVTPVPLTLTVTPVANPDPLIVTGTVAPTAP